MTVPPPHCISIKVWYVDPHLPLLGQTCIYSSPFPSFLSDAPPPHQNLIIFFFFFCFLEGITRQNFGKHDHRQERRLMAVFSSIHNRHRHSRVLLPCVVGPSLSLIAFSFGESRRRKKGRKMQFGRSWQRDTLDLYLYSFIVPIIPYMLIDRIQIDPANVQAVTSALLANYALVCLISSPIVGHYADKTTDRKTPLLIALAIELSAAVTVAGTTNCELSLKDAILHSFRPDADYIFSYLSGNVVHRANFWSHLGNDAMDYWLFHSCWKYWKKTHGHGQRGRIGSNRGWSIGGACGLRILCGKSGILVCLVAMFWPGKFPSLPHQCSL